MIQREIATSCCQQCSAITINVSISLAHGSVQLYLDTWRWLRTEVGVCLGFLCCHVLLVSLRSESSTYDTNVKVDSGTHVHFGNLWPLGNVERAASVLNFNIVYDFTRDSASSVATDGRPRGLGGLDTNPTTHASREKGGGLLPLTTTTTRICCSWGGSFTEELFNLGYQILSDNHYSA